MEVQPRTTRAEYNEATRRETRRRFGLIVLLPMGLVLLLVIVLTVLFSARPDQGVWSRSAYAQMAAICLAVPMCLGSLLQLALLGGLGYGVAKLSNKLPPVFFKVNRAVQGANRTIDSVSTKAAQPLIAVHARGAWLGRFVRALRAPRGPKQPGTP